MKKFLLFLSLILWGILTGYAQTYTKVTDTSTLKAGDKIVILGDNIQSGNSNPYFIIGMSPNISKTNIPGTVLSQSSSKQSLGNEYTFPEGKTPVNITLEASGNSDYPWLLRITVNNVDYYIGCSSTSSKSSIKYTAIKDKDATCEAKIDGTFQFNTTQTRKSLEITVNNGKTGETTYNCYVKGAQKTPVIYKLKEAEEPKALGDLAVTYGDNQSVADNGSATVPEGTVFNFKAENATFLTVTDVEDNVIAEGTDAAAWTAVRGEYILTATATGVDATGAAATKSIIFELNVTAPQPKDYAPEFSDLSVAVGSTLALAPTADNAAGADAPAITYAIKSGDALTLSGSSVTGVKVGSATITASWTAVPDKWNAGSKDFTVSVTPKPTGWTLVKDASGLKAGQKYIVVYNNGDTKKSMSTSDMSSSKNPAVDVAISSDNILTPAETSLILTLEANDNNWCLKTDNRNKENEYLSCSGSSNTNISFAQNPSDKTNMVVSISFNNNNAKIQFTKNNRYLGVNPNFGAYAESNTGYYSYIQLYTQAVEETECAAPVFDPVAGDVRRGQVINFTTTTEGASVYYTVNDGGAEVGTSYTIPADATDGSMYEIRATATKDGLADATNSATYTVRVPQLGEITFDHADGSTIEQGTRVIVTADNATAITYVLTVNDRDRQEQTLDETGSVAILDYGTVKITVTAQGEGGPKTASATYTVTQKFPGAPTFSVADGSAVVSGTEVTVTVPDAGVIIITPYLIDGSLGEPRRVQTHNSQAGTTFTVDKWNRRFKVQGSLYGNLGQEAEAFYSLKAAEQPAGDVYELITEKSQLTDGIEVLFVGYAGEDPYVMTSDIITGTNNAFNVAVAKNVTSNDKNKITTIPEKANIVKMIKGGVEDEWFLYANGNGGYLYASNNGNEGNGMYYKEDTENCNATISFSDGGPVTFTFQKYGVVQNNIILKFNNSSKRFSCYKASSGNTKTFYLYKKAESTPGTEVSETCDYPITVNHGTYEPWDDEQQPSAAPAREAAATASAEMDAVTAEDGTITYTARLNNMAGLFSLNLEGENGSLMGHRTDAVACDETCTEHPKHVYVQPGQSYNLVHSANENAVQLSTIDLHNVNGNGYKTADLTVTLDPFRSATMSLAGDSQELTGVTDVAVDNAAAPVEYYDLQGRRIDAPAAGSVVIRRQGADVRKIHIR